MKVYRLDKPNPSLVADGQMDLLPVRSPDEPISGYAIQVAGWYLVELSFQELRRIAEVSTRPSAT